MDENNHNRNIDALYRRHLPELLRLAGKYRHPPDLCQEIVHEAVARVLAVKEPASIEELRLYVVAAVRNLAIDIFRAEDRRRPKHVVLRNTAQLHGDQPSPELDYLDEQIERLIKRLKSMPAPERRAIKSLVFQQRDKKAATQASKLSGFAFDRRLLRLAAELTRLLKHHRRDKK